MIVFAIVAASTGQAAELNGRYQAINITNHDETGNTVFILDTTTGDIWKWFEAGAIGGAPAGSGIRYEGKATPGDQPGEMVARQGFSQPPVLRKRN
jgi:hypothetical protein